MADVVILQSYVPSYRVELFELMATKLRALGYSFNVVAGQPVGRQSLRADAIHEADWLVPASVREWEVFGHAVRRKQRLREHLVGARVVVSELTVGNVDTWRLLFRRQRGLEVALWGHVNSYVRQFRPGEEWLNRLLLGRAAHVFAYTSGGAQRARRFVSDDRVTCVYNATGGSALLQPNEVSRVIATRRSSSWLFLGSVDESKRLELLVDVVQRAAREIDGFELVVAGEGPRVGVVEEAIRRGLPVRLIGRVDEAGKAALARECAGILMPGRVGLVAVDAFRMALPIITTSWPFHGPEAEYLRHGENALFVKDTPLAITRALQRISGDYDLRARLSTNCYVDSQMISVTNMADRFVAALVVLIERGRSKDRAS